MGIFIMPAVLIVIGAGLLVPGLGNGIMIWPLVIGIGLLAGGISSLKNSIWKWRDTRGMNGKSSRKLLNRIGDGRISGQGELKAIVLNTKYYTEEERRAAFGKLTDQQALKEVVGSGDALGTEALKRITDKEYLKEVVKSNVGGKASEALSMIDDQAFLAKVAGEGTRAVPGLNPGMQVEALRRISDPEILAGIGDRIVWNNNHDLARVWLERVYKAAVDDPQMMLKVSGNARRIIRGAHTDGQKAVGGRHNDGWQRVPHMSSDCHEDHTPWTQAKGPWGEWGYHGDGMTGGTTQHQDTNALSTWKNKFPG